MANSKARKTADINSIKKQVNEMLANSKGDDSTDIARRQGMCLVLEDILHNNNQYLGFQYLESKDVPEGMKPGVFPDNKAGNRFPEGKVDETRRFYY